MFQQANKPTSPKRHNSITAFTLIELMVVVGIITILGMIVGPGFKKAYEDFYLRKTLSDADELVQGIRSYYLIYNEMPPDCKNKYIAKEVAPFLSSHLFEKNKVYNKSDGEYAYRLTADPFGDSSLGWDFNEWISWNGNTTTVYINLSVQTPKSWNSEKVNRYINAFKKQYSLDVPQPFLFEHDVDYMLIPFSEFPLNPNIDSVSPNRYY